MARKAYGLHATQVNTSTYADDPAYPIGSNEWNEALDNEGMLGFTPQTATVTLSSNALLVTDTVTVVAGESGAADDIDTITLTNTSEYDLLYLFGQSSYDVTLKHTSSLSSNGQIQTVSGSDEVLSATSPTILIRKGNYWYGYGGGVVNAVSDIGDVTISGIGSGELLKWNGSAWINQTLTEAGIVNGNLGTPSALVGTNISGTASNLTAGTSSVATTVTITDNESTNEDNAIIFTAGGAVTGGNLGLESDGTCTYNPSTGKITATGFVGALTGDVTGNAATATEATNITAVANNSNNETVYPTFVDGATGTQGLETDTGLNYNPSTGLLSAVGLTLSGDLTVNGTTTTIDTTNLVVEDPLIQLAKNNNAADTVDIGFWGLYDTSGSQDLYSGLFRDANDSGKWKLFKDTQAAPTTTVNTSGTGYATATLVANIEGNLTGNVTGNTSGTAATVTQAAQSAITSVGTLTGLTMGGAIAMGGNDITNGGVIFLTEQAEAEADVTGKGQIWVDTATPNKLMFTDDAGTDFDLTAGGGATLFHVFSNSTTTTYAGQTGESQTLGTAVGSLASGSGDRDIYIRKIDTNNEGVFAVIHKNGALVEVQVA